ncbi:ABC transporter, ATP-binding protein [Methylomonas albis]|uniref:ABC transporter ATP-binding protein n=1 Tax=Methylomonas albis TaxID=1854563 RepID=A0ABR9D0S6_9GAMM|nr:ABC transporter ATP-binding protein [Methylomonas albis]MBD9355824.1 ABC transporter ATP-binding protein [Methylomonas albis]CAD6878848.1 ABC transporter, ATP-binding protein [Methylomonas albis]
MLEACELSKAYGANLALNALNLRVAPGEIFCLLGANGAGKTTTIHLFLNFIAPSVGVARIGGFDVSRDTGQARQMVAYLPENVALYPRLSGVENLDYFSRLSGHRYAKKQLRNFLMAAGLLEEAADKPVANYSKGMRQKVGIAIACAKEAKVLLLDEPTSGLDPQASYEFSNLLRTLADSGVAILMATHDLFRVKESGHRAGIMKGGKMLTVLNTGEISAAELERIYLQYMQAGLHVAEAAL